MRARAVSFVSLPDPADSVVCCPANFCMIAAFPVDLPCPWRHQQTSPLILSFREHFPPLRTRVRGSEKAPRLLMAHLGSPSSPQYTDSRRAAGCLGVWHTCVCLHVIRDLCDCENPHLDFAKRLDLLQSVPRRWGPASGRVGDGCWALGCSLGLGLES